MTAKKVEKELTKVIEKISRVITLNILTNLTFSTPVDTGFARANWTPNVGGPGRSSRTSNPTASDVSAAEARKSAGKGKVERYVLRQGNLFITNNAPYIVELNSGSSAQAPRGFVEDAIRKALSSDLRRFSS